MLAGLAPIARDSGDSPGTAISRGGRAARANRPLHGRPLGGPLQPAAQGVLRTPHRHGKKAKVALTAVMRKLVLLANTLVREDRLWQPNHA